MKNWTVKNATTIFLIYLGFLGASRYIVRYATPNIYGVLIRLILSATLLGLIPVFFAKNKFNKIAKPLGLLRTRGKYYFIAFITGIFLFLSYKYVLRNQESAVPANNFPIWFFACVLLGKMFIIPISEEIYYRGVLFNALLNSKGFFFALILSSVIFGIFHINPFFPISISNLLFKIIYLILFSLLYLSSKSLLPAILCHVVVNVLVGITNLYYL